MLEIINHIQTNWVEWLFTVLLAIAGAGFKIISGKLKIYKKEQEALKEGVLALLHDRLYQGCKYHIRQEEISDEEMKNMEYLYKGYHALGGNGTGTELYERVKKLPLKEE